MNHSLPISLDDNYLEAISEDCLYLNIWRPHNASKDAKLPVLVYYHGGSLTTGQSYYYQYNGENFAKEDVIMVSVAYRLGVFGYYANDELANESANHTTGNYGLLDQIAALKWVNENIEAFGGDPSNITIAGESAGASSVNAICVSPLAKGLFKRAIAESSGLTARVPYHTFRTYNKALETGHKIMEEFNCSSIEELRKIPAEELVKTKYSNNSMCIDGYAITKQPYLTYLENENNEEALLNGSNKDEGDVFLMFGSKPTTDTYEEFLTSIAGDYANELVKLRPVSNNEEAKKQYYDLVGNAWFGYSHYCWSNLLAAQNKPVYLYYFAKQNKGISAWHSGELPYFYRNLPKTAAYNQSDKDLEAIASSYIINFVKTGNPNGTNLPTWDSYNTKPNQIMQLAEEVKMINNDYLEIYQVFDKYMNSKKN